MSDLHVTPLWSPCLIIVTVFWHFSRSRATVKSQWALAALFQRIKMNNSFPETTNVLFSRTGPSQSSLLGQLLLLQMAKASSLSSGWLPSVSGPSSGASPFLPQLSRATQPLLDGCIIQTQSWDLMHVFVSCGCASLFQGLLLWIFSLNVILQGFQTTKQLCSKNYLASLLPGQHFQIIYTYIHTCTLPVKRLEWFSFFFFLYQTQCLSVWVQCFKSYIYKLPIELDICLSRQQTAGQLTGFGTELMCIYNKSEILREEMTYECIKSMFTHLTSGMQC